MMRNPLSKKITGIEPSGIRKFFDLVSEMPDAISLGVGEPDFDTPWRIREEGIYTLEQGKTFYTSNAGLKDLKIEISKYLERKIHVEYDPDHEIMVTVGGSEGIDVALRAMLDPGDEVLIPQPSYVSYLPCTILADGNPVIIPLQEKNEFKLTAEELEEEAKYHMDAEAAPSVAKAIRLAVDYADENNLAGVVVCGSLYLAAQARPLLLKEAEK